jgi:hypothetical protein
LQPPFGLIEEVLVMRLTPRSECSSRCSLRQSKFQKVLKVQEGDAGASGNSRSVDVGQRSVHAAVDVRAKKKLGRPEDRPRGLCAVVRRQLKAGVSGLSGVTTRMPTAVADGTEVTPFVARTTTW